MPPKPPPTRPSVHCLPPERTVVPIRPWIACTQTRARAPAQSAGEERVFPMWSVFLIYLSELTRFKRWIPFVVISYHSGTYIVIYFRTLRPVRAKLWCRNSFVDWSSVHPVSTGWLYFCTVFLFPSDSLLEYPWKCQSCNDESGSADKDDGAFQGISRRWGTPRRSTHWSIIKTDHLKNFLNAVLFYTPDDRIHCVGKNLTVW